MASEPEGETSPNDGFLTRTSIQAAPAALRIGNYELVKLLGRGGMGEVHLACHARMKDRRYAIKTILPHGASAGVISRFEREITVLSKLAHPNFLYAVDAGEHEGKLYLVTEFIDGIDLTKLVAKVGPLPVADACEIVRQMALGLAAAHAENIIHRDIKPSNVMLDRSGKPKILDLGLALIHNSSDLALTTERNVIGTPEYMAPEQWRGSHDVTPASDIYSLGCTLFFLVTGAPPFSAKKYPSLPMLMEAHLGGEPPEMIELIPTIDRGLSELVVRCLAKLPEERPRDCSEIAEALASFAAGSDLKELVAKTVPEAATAKATSIEAPREDISNLPTQNDDWSRFQEKFEWNWPLVFAGTFIILLCLASLMMAYFGPGTTEAWSRHFDRLQDKNVPAGTGFIIETVRIILFVTTISAVCMLRFAEPLRRFLSPQLNVPAVWIARCVVLFLIAFFIRAEGTREWNPSGAGAELTKWAAERGIETTPEKEAVPYRWYLPYTICIYVFVFAGLIACPLLQFCLSDFRYLRKRLAALAENLAATRKPQAKVALLYQFAHGCRDLTARYVDAGGVLAIGIQYDFWIGKYTMSDQGFAIEVLAWATVAMMVVLFLVICYVYSRAIELTANSCGAHDMQTEQGLNQIGLIWLLKSALLNRMSGLACLSLAIVAAVALLTRSH